MTVCSKCCSHFFSSIDNALVCCRNSLISRIFPDIPLTHREVLPNKPMRLSLPCRYSNPCRPLSERNLLRFIQVTYFVKLVDPAQARFYPRLTSQRNIPPLVTCLLDRYCGIPSQLIQDYSAICSLLRSIFMDDKFLAILSTTLNTSLEIGAPRLYVNFANTVNLVFNLV